MSIESVTIRGGIAPWTQAVVEWTGNSATWRLVNAVTQELLYYGPELRYDMTTHPETIYHLDLIDDIGTHQPFAYVSPPISAPVELVATDITDTTATLKWMPLAAVSSYEVLVDEVSSNVDPPPPTEQPSLALAGLEPDRTYAVQARAFMESTSSLWSPMVYFTTRRTLEVEASLYEYVPSAAGTRWGNYWLAAGQSLSHGSGEMFGAPGIHTTVFIYSANTLKHIRELKGVRVLSAQIAINRTSENSDPRMVMSHFLLHNMTSLPAGAPTFIEPAMGVDSGQAALSQQVWINLPVRWIDAIINGDAAGFGWGGVSGRYMRAHPITHPTLRPITGTLRITVG